MVIIAPDLGRSRQKKSSIGCNENALLPRLSHLHDLWEEMSRKKPGKKLCPPGCLRFCGTPSDRGRRKASETACLGADFFTSSLRSVKSFFATAALLSNSSDRARICAGGSAIIFLWHKTRNSIFVWQTGHGNYCVESK